MDYWPYVDLKVHDDWNAYLSAEHDGRMLGFSARRGRPYTSCAFQKPDRLFFGKETKGLGAELLDQMADDVYTIPIAEPAVRSLNLANAVGIVVYEALRQTDHEPLLVEP